MPFNSISSAFGTSHSLLTPQLFCTSKSTPFQNSIVVLYQDLVVKTEIALMHRETRMASAKTAQHATSVFDKADFDEATFTQHKQAGWIYPTLGKMKSIVRIQIRHKQKKTHQSIWMIIKRLGVVERASCAYRFSERIMLWDLWHVYHTMKRVEGKLKRSKPKRPEYRNGMECKARTTVKRR